MSRTSVALLAVVASCAVAACGASAEEDLGATERQTYYDPPADYAAPAAARPGSRQKTRSADRHEFGSMELAFRALEQAYSFLDPQEWYCYWESADKRPQEHYRCEYTDGGAYQVTVHITPVGNPTNYITLGWDERAAHRTALNGPDGTLTELPSLDDIPIDDIPSYETPGDFCETHDCIENFDEGNGYVVQCADGTWSQSGGIQGACSHHGGVADPGSVPDVGSDYDPNNDGSPYNWCGASRDGDGDGLWCEGR